VLNGGVSASERKIMKGCCQWCFSNGKNDEGLLSMVFQQREKAKQLLDGVVSSMKYGEEMVDCSVLGVGRKSVEQWCFSIGEKVIVLSNGVSASGNSEKLL
jgi:hypothetical protein